MPSISGNKDCIVGDKFEIGDSSKTSTDYYAVEVLDIDESNLTATIRIHQRIARIIPDPQVVGQIFAGVVVDGGEIVVVGGQVKPVPPRGPVHQLVKEVARYLDVENSTDNVGMALTARREVLEGVFRSLVNLYTAAEPISEEPPRKSIRDNLNP